MHDQSAKPGTVPDLRSRIDHIDHELLALWQERGRLSQQVGRARLAEGGTRLALAREQQIVARYRSVLGADGVALALLVLRAGRGPL